MNFIKPCEHIHIYSAASIYALFTSYSEKQAIASNLCIELYANAVSIQRPGTRREFYSANSTALFLHLQCLPMCADQTNGIIGYESYDTRDVSGHKQSVLSYH